MTRRLSVLISWGCAVLLVAVPAIALYLLLDLASFRSAIRSSLNLPIAWHTVVDWQWYAQWVLTTLFLSIGVVGLFYLRRAFANFARGELFNLANSSDIRRFSKLLLLQTLITPLHFALSSVLLSLNHPAGQKVLSISFGSNEFRAVGIALILWVMSNLLVEGYKLQAENQQFI